MGELGLKITDFPGWSTLSRLIAETGIELNPRCWLAGGSLLRAATGEPFSDADLDFWCQDYAAFEAAETALKKSAAEITKGKAFADTYFFQTVSGARKTRAQLIYRFEESPQKCIDNFDFSVCQLAWDGSRLYWGGDTKADIATKTLRIVNASSRTPKRLDDYQARGYRITTETVLSAMSAKQGGYEYEENAA